MIIQNGTTRESENSGWEHREKTDVRVKGIERCRWHMR